MFRQKKTAVFFALIIVALFAFGAAILPTLVKNRVRESIQQFTGRPTSVESVSINPIKMAITAKGIVVEEKGGGPFVVCACLSASIRPSSIFRKVLVFKEVTIESPSFTISRTAPNRFSFADILERLQERDSRSLFSINSLTVTNGSVHFNDAVPKGGFKVSLNSIDLKLKHFTTAADTAAEYELSLQVDNDAPLASEGSFSLSPLAASGQIELTGLNLLKGWPYLARIVTKPLKGVLDLSGHVSFSKSAGVIAKNGRISIKNLSTSYGKNEALEVSSLLLSGASYAHKENILEIAEAKMSKINASVSRESDGNISVRSILTASRNTSASKQLPAAAHVKVSPVTSSANVPVRTKLFSYRLKRVEVDRLNLLFTDKSRPGTPAFNLRNATIFLENLNGPHFTSAPLRFSTTYGTQTRFQGSGNITPHPFRFKGDIGIDRLPVKDFHEYLPENLNINIVEGNLDAALKMDISIKEGTTIGSFSGRTGVRAFRCTDKIAAEDLFKWESLQVGGLSGSLDPFRLDVREIALNGVYARFIVREDGTLNVQNLIQKPSTSVQGSIPTKTDATTPFVTIGAVTIQDGTLSFSDNRLEQQFSTTLYSVGGRISGLSSEEFRFADVDLRGNLESQSPLQITGKINPLRKDLFVDLKVSFHDIELVPASPYSGTYLGYTVQKGKLFLDLKYHIEKKLLTSENKIFIDQFSFGKKVESDKATTLPVEFALSLLKDRKGEIHLDVPVSGLTNDPEFSVWKLVFKAVKNIVVKMASSPLSVLSSIFGNGEDFSAIRFDYGTSVIPLPDEPKLIALSKALLDRPALKVELKGYVDHDKDREAYRHELLKRKLKNEKFIALGKEGTLKSGDTSDTIQLQPEDFVTYLAAVYKKEKFPKPRNVLGLIKNLPPDEMSKLIIANTIIGAPEFQALARQRVDAVRSYLVIKGNVPDKRIFQVDEDVFKKPENDSLPGSRVEISAKMR